MHGKNACDVLIVIIRNCTLVFVDVIVKIAYRNILRSFVRKWLNYTKDFSLSAVLEPGGIGMLRYSPTFVLKIWITC